MKTIERIFQAVLFEAVALAIVVPTSALVGGYATEKMAIVGIALSTFAMCWNYLYNILFDKIAGESRQIRGAATRIIHACCFELGMVIITLPVLAWYLNITWLAAIILETSFLIFILFYTLIFNWLYDNYQPYQRLVNRS
ncbi:MAG: PACE efflux transporter [Paraglaciecola sp.]|uniref:PACE efflux transporter n=1 Tax=Paraglaciecola sp. TaxID=1920173 RepID=UPI00329A24F9